MSGIIVQPQTLFAIGPSRQFGGLTSPPNQNDPAAGNGSQPIFQGYVTVSESSTDAIEVTKQPVQQGAPISDHAFKKPTLLSIQIQMGQSLTKSLASIYNDLLSLQSSFQPFNCITPKRTYYNMLFSALGVTTDKHSENILSINASFEQIITVPIGITIVDRSKLRNPGANAQTQNVGSKQAQSTLFKAVDAVKGVLK